MISQKGVITRGSFIPKNLFVKSDVNSPFKGAVKQVKYCCFDRHENYHNEVLIEQYYHPNFAKTEIISYADFIAIDMIEISADTVEMYERVFYK